MSALGREAITASLTALCKKLSPPLPMLRGQALPPCLLVPYRKEDEMRYASRSRHDSKPVCVHSYEAT
jgi:hypothetical protein